MLIRTPLINSGRGERGGEGGCILRHVNYNYSGA